MSRAVACADEPYDGALQPGDVILRFSSQGPRDRVGLDVVIEVTSKWCEDRADTRQDRVSLLITEVSSAVPSRSVGAVLLLPVTAWDQSDR